MTTVEVLAEAPEWLSYELPEHLLGVALKGRYRGQRQKWFAMRFLGSDSEIDIAARGGARPSSTTGAGLRSRTFPASPCRSSDQIYEDVLAEFAHSLWRGAGQFSTPAGPDSASAAMP